MAEKRSESRRSRKTRALRYKSIAALMKAHKPPKEGEDTLDLIRRARKVRRTKRISRDLFIEMCKWKSPRAIRLIRRNRTKTVQRTVRQVLSTEYEKERMELLTSLNGVSIPMASAILMLIEPRNYGVIDIRVWKLLHEMGSVRRRPSGRGFNFNDWYYYLCKLRYHARKTGWAVRQVEKLLFDYHRETQRGLLYAQQML